MSLKSAIGIDPGLRHGAAVYATWEWSPDEPHENLYHMRPLFVWDKKHPKAIGQKDEPKRVYALANAIITEIANWLPSQRCPVAIDWTRFSVHMKSRKLQAVQLAFLLGYLTRGLQTQGYPVVFLSPAQVRKALGTGSADKAQVWAAFTEKVHIDMPNWDILLKNEDLRDSLILSYLISQPLEPGRDSSTQISLPGCET